MNTAPRGRSRTASILLAAALLAFLAWSVTAVPDGSLGVLPDGDVLPPGWHLRPFAPRPILQGPGPLVLDGEAAVETPEGARLEVPYRLEIVIEPGAIQQVLENTALGSPARRWTEGLHAALREEIAGGRADLLYTGAVGRSVLARLRAAPTPLSASRAIDLRLGAAAASGRRGRTPGAPVLFVGLDGADWLFMRPLLETGKLPNLERLLRRGARAQLRSARPMLSPLLWTSMVTGVTPDRHGILDFAVYDPSTRDRTPISSRARRQPALWNVLTAYGLHSAWIGWWATWPAEPVAGLMVSDRVSYSMFALDDAGGASGKVYPPAVWRQVQQRITPAAQVPWSDLKRFARLTEADVARLRRRAPPAPGQEFEDRLDHLRQILASTRSYHAQALWAHEVLRPDLLSVYYQGIDEVSHRFMHFVPPPRMEPPAAEAGKFERTVEEFYRYQDELLGELVAAERSGAEPIVLVVSDHGFLSGEARPARPADEFEGGAADWHRLHGVFILTGPGVRPSDLGTVSIYDVFPTLLYLCGLPVPDGLPGRALVEALEPSFVSRHALETVADLSVPFGPAAQEPAALPEDERAEALSRLRALGYVGAQAPERGPGGGEAEAPSQAGLRNEFLTAHMNLGAIHAERAAWEEAAREYRSVAERFPQYAPALYKWMESELEDGNTTAAWDAAQRLLALRPPPLEWLPAIAKVAAAGGRASALEETLGDHPSSSATAVARGILTLEEGRPQEAAAHFRRSLDINPLHTEAVEALFRLDPSPGGREELRHRLQRALQMAPRSVFHLNYLAGLLVGAGRCPEARPYILTALEENPDSAPAHANLAKCLVAQGQPEQAVAALERGLVSAPNDRALLTTLGALEAGRGRLARAVELLERARNRFPRDPAILNALGLALLQSGRPDEARRLLRQSLEADPNQPEVRSLLAEAGG